MATAKDIKSLKKVLVASRQKGYRKIEAKNEGYSASAKKKKIKGKKTSYPLNFPEMIGYQS